MKRIKLAQQLGSALALSVALVSPVRADLVLLGSDYFQTIQPTNFSPLGAANPLTGLPIGPGTTDTIVRRLGDCALSLFVNLSNCTIPIEMVALSLISVPNPAVRLRESPTLSSAGAMTMTSDGSGTGGTFDSFFDVFVELSLDGGMSWAAQAPLQLSSSNTHWTTSPQGLQVHGMRGDQDANVHDIPGPMACQVGAGACVDFFLVGTVTETHPGVGVHTVVAAIPEPGGAALVGLALAALGVLGQRQARCQKNARPA